MANLPVQILPPRLPLNRKQFANAVQKGHGRALMHVQRYGATKLEDLIIDACVHARAYDPQCEGDRTCWLMKIIDAGKLEASVRQPILDTLVRCDSEARFWDLSQMCGITATLAARGSEDARRALYATLAKNLGSMDLIGAQEIIELDGGDGLIHVAQCLGEWLRRDPQTQLDDLPLKWFDERHGHESASRVLELVASSDQNVRAYLDYLENLSEGEAAHSTQQAERSRLKLEPLALEDGGREAHIRRMQAISVDQVLEGIQEDDDSKLRFPLNSWGGYADSADLRVIADVMLAETDTTRLRKYLMVFMYRSLPSFDRRLLPLLDHENERVRWYSIQVLANHRHDEVRRIAVKRLNQQGAQSGALPLLRNNYRSGDHRLIERQLRISDDSDEVHRLVSDLVDVFEANPSPDARLSMLFVYEHSPCSNCRGDAVKILIAWGSAPDWLLEECWFDADECIRDAVVQSGSPPSPGHP